MKAAVERLDLRYALDSPWPLAETRVVSAEARFVPIDRLSWRREEEAPSATVYGYRAATTFVRDVSVASQLIPFGQVADTLREYCSLEMMFELDALLMAYAASALASHLTAPRRILSLFLGVAPTSFELPSQLFEVLTRLSAGQGGFNVVYEFPGIGGSWQREFQALQHKNPELRFAITGLAPSAAFESWRGFRFRAYKLDGSLLADGGDERIAGQVRAALAAVTELSPAVTPVVVGAPDLATMRRWYDLGVRLFQRARPLEGLSLDRITVAGDLVPPDDDPASALG